MRVYHEYDNTRDVAIRVAWSWLETDHHSRVKMNYYPHSPTNCTAPRPNHHTCSKTVHNTPANNTKPSQLHGPMPRVTN